MAKVIRGEGSGEFRGKSFRAEFQVFDTVTGEVTTEKKSMPIKSRTQAEKKRALREFRKELESEARYDSRLLTVSQLSELWLKSRDCDPDVKKATLRKDKTRLKAINLNIGNFRVQELKPDHVRKMLGWLSEGKTPSGKPASGTYRNGIFTTLSQMLDHAVDEEVIIKNPCDKVKAPKVDTKERDFLSPDKVKRMKLLFEALPVVPSLIGFVLALFAGLRRGEVCALRWKHFDAVQGTLRVDSSLSPDDGLGDPKTDSGFRVIPLPAFLVDFLVQWKVKQAKMLLLTLRVVQDDETPIMNSREGGFMHPDNLDRAWSRFRSKHGFDGYTLHQLRHTYATFLFAGLKNNPDMNLKIVQYLMGHSDPAFTMKLYIHYCEYMGEAARNVLDDLIAQFEIAAVSVADNSDAPSEGVELRRLSA